MLQREKTGFRIFPFCRTAFTPLASIAGALEISQGLESDQQAINSGASSSLGERSRSISRWWGLPQDIRTGSALMICRGASCLLQKCHVEPPATKIFHAVSMADIFEYVTQEVRASQKTYHCYLVGTSASAFIALSG
jgi:hypothetical protein